MLRYLASQSIPVIITFVVVMGMLSLMVVRLLVNVVARSKKPLNISSPISGMAATAFVFIAALLAAQIQGDIASARQAMYHEVAAIQMIRLHAEVLTAQEQAAFGAILQGYVRQVVSDEWKSMQLDGESRTTRGYLGTLLRLIHQVKEQDVRESLRTSANELMAARMARLRVAADTVPMFTWIILGCLSLCSMFTLALNHGDHHQWQRVVGVTVVLLTSLIFTLLLVYDQPYARPDIVNPQALLDALR